MITFRIFLISFLGIFLLCCKQFKGNNDTGSSDSVSTSGKVIIEREQKDTSVVIKLVEHKKDGLILPGEYKVYDENIKILKRLKVKGIEKLIILQKSKVKHPQLTNQDYCSWSNYLRVVYNNDTAIMFGNSILEIEEQYKDLVISGDSCSIIIASDFSMEAGDDDGLTGCDDFSYMILRTGNGQNFKIVEQNSVKSQSENFATLVHDDGMNERIDNYLVNGDTIIFNVKVEYQDGNGEYNLKIFKSGEWKFKRTDEKREN